MTANNNNVTTDPTMLETNAPVVQITPLAYCHSKKLFVVVVLILISVVLIYSPTTGKAGLLHTHISGVGGVLDAPPPPSEQILVKSGSSTKSTSSPLKHDDKLPVTSISGEKPAGKVTMQPPPKPTLDQKTTFPVANDLQLIFTRPKGINSPECSLQPNQTDIESYDRCPLPGLNNLLYSQINRWYCAFRDRRHLRLRDRTCQKVLGTAEPYRYSTILQVNYEEAKNTYKREASICWGDWKKQDKSCEWGDIPQFYGTPDWWVARSLIDFHPIYYQIADDMLRRAFRVVVSPDHQPTILPPFITVHLRRGDYDKHCKLMTSKKEPSWLSFRATKGLRKGIEGCYPNLNSVTESLQDIQKTTGIKHIFIATNSPMELEGVAAAVTGVLMMNYPAFNFSSYESQELLGGAGTAPDVIERNALYKAKYAHKFRDVDRVIVEMCIMIRGKHFLFNKFSSLSATVYEQARVNGNIAAKDGNVITW